MKFSTILSAPNCPVANAAVSFKPVAEKKGYQPSVSDLPTTPPASVTALPQARLGFWPQMTATPRHSSSSIRANTGLQRSHSLDDRVRRIATRTTLLAHTRCRGPGEDMIQLGPCWIAAERCTVNNPLSWNDRANLLFVE